MMSFFPVPYQDEVLYSMLARYVIRSGNIGLKSSMKDIFGSKNATAVMDLPSNLNALVLNLPINTEYNADYFIENHTLYLFYSAFLPPERVGKVIDSMKGKTGGDIYNRTGIMASSITLNRFFKFCPDCVKDDTEKYGETYWHRMHQIPCLNVCYKHSSPLYDSIVPVRGYNKHEYTAASKENCITKGQELSFTDDIIMKSIALVADAEVLVKNSFSKRPVKWFREQYLAKLAELNLATVNGKVNQRDFLRLFIDFYGEEFLNLVQSKISTDSECNWLSDMVRTKDKSVHPIRHLLLMRFLEIPILEMFDKKYEYKPFGDGRWPCLNAACQHYLEPVINEVNITYSTDCKAPIGTFVCKCGFEYMRSGPDASAEDKFRFGRIKKFGQIWEDKLRKLVGMKLSLRETAKCLNVDPITVGKYSKKLGLTTYWEKRKISEHENDDYSTDDLLTSKNSYELRERWLRLMTQHPSKSKTELRAMDKALYVWLYRNDRIWLNHNSPATKLIMSTNSRVDWDARDTENLGRVEQVVKNILTLEEKPERISLSLIGSKLGLRGLLEKHIDKLPLIKKYILDNKESTHDYQVRRIKWAIRELRKKNEGVETWKVIRMAGIRKEYLNGLESEINALMIYEKRETSDIYVNAQNSTGLTPED